MLLELAEVHQTYARQRVLEGLSFRLESGRIACLLGPSGCGKTTVLRCIAGFEPISRGEIRADGVLLSGAGTMLAAERRAIGMVFQDYALFPHLNVFDNVRFGLHKLGRDEQHARVELLLGITGLEEIRSLYPHELSGGQQQRVALARALAPRPGLLLLDEPFSSLDIDLRERLGREVRGILKHLGTTALLVTHDQREAFAFADEVGVMHAGRIEQWASPNDLYYRPASRFVAEFVGEGSFVHGEVLADGRIQTELGVLTMGSASAHAPGAPVDVLLRPDDLEHDTSSAITATVLEKAFRGAGTLYTLKVGEGTPVLALLASRHDYPIGAHLGVRLAAGHVAAFPRA